jgi:hypothetical protein
MGLHQTQILFGIICIRVVGIFVTTAFRPALGPTQLPIQWVPGALSFWVKWPGREADHTTPSSAAVRMRGAIPPLPRYAFMARFHLKILLGKFKVFGIFTSRNCAQKWISVVLLHRHRLKHLKEVKSQDFKLCTFYRTGRFCENRR